ncbi:glycosyltransferase family 4 protein [Candidatus Stoquefichus sp. SB1]|uniref:glycosyltransferase family 4 protein n=1 Tax=Candidatus Stoquefichus sp. SB1 TaxID=1658109 RepID=UPI00067EA178|nr:glycosyltransferase family 4 protein [Candidatus Stoquefichus sp. SB1]
MKSENYILITVLDSISETSMPLNEFVIYRQEHYQSSKQIIIICDKEGESTVQIPSNIECIYVNRNTKYMNKVMNDILAQYQYNIIVHLHQLRSAILFYKATFRIRRKLKIVFTVHSTFQMRSIKYKLSSMLCALLSNVTICVSNSSYYYYSNIIKKIKKEKIYVIQNGVDTERIDNIVLNLGEKQANEIPLIVNVGRIIPLKNQQLLVKIFPKLNKCKVVLVGSENDNYQVQKMILDLGLQDKIIITGLIPRKDVFLLLKQADLFISTSKIEGLPISVLEAMYVGLPVILSDILPHQEIFNGQDNNDLLPLNDEILWINKINMYLSLTKQEMLKRGQQNKQIALKYFSLKVMHEEYNKLYLKLIKK